MFTVADRARLQHALTERAAADDRVVSAALVGSLAIGAADRWSDIDISLGIADDVDPADLLHDWSTWLSNDVHATMLLDWPKGATVYRIFLLPNCLQVDLSVSRASDFTRRSPRFRLLFGQHLTAEAADPSRQEILAYAVLYAVEARRDIERGRVWQAQHYIGQVREHALTLACVNRGLPALHGKGYDRLPSPLLDAFAGTLVVSLSPAALRQALATAMRLLLIEADGIGLATALENPLAEIAGGAFH